MGTHSSSVSTAVIHNSPPPAVAAMAMPAASTADAVATMAT